MTRKANDDRKRCELMTNPAKRDAANKLAASVKGGFPPGLSQPALRALAGAGYTRLDQLAHVSEADLRKLHGVGPKAIGVIGRELTKHGLSFRSK
ncbi:MAG: DNA-binding protein [Gemmatimonadota bacterium]